MKVKLHNPSNSEPQFVPGLGVLTPNEWTEFVEDDEVVMAEFKAVNGFDLKPTNAIEIEGQAWPPPEEEGETDVVVEEEEEE